MAAKGSNLKITLLSLSCYFFIFISPSHSDRDTLTQTEGMGDWDCLVSAGGTFKLAFFSPGTSTDRYLGILYNNLQLDSDYQKVAWVANRNKPISESTGSLLIDEFGTLEILWGGWEKSNSIVLSYTGREHINASATLLDSGNLVLSELNPDTSPKRVLWQSFDYPTDTLLPGMKLGRNLKTGHLWSLTSWRSDEVPATGSFTLGGDPNGTSQLIIWWQGKVFWTSGLLNGGRFEFFPRIYFKGKNYMFSYISNENEKYLTFSMKENNNMLDYRMDSRGIIIEDGVEPYGSCSSSHRFGGCLKQKLPKCRKNNKQFKEIRGYPQNDGFKFNENYKLSLYDCMAKCLNNCSCVAYASPNDNQTGCEIWSRGMKFSDEYSGRVIYILHKDKVFKWWVWLITAVAGFLFLLAFCSICYLIQRKFREEGKGKTEQEILLSELGASTTHSSNSGKTKKLNRNGKKRSRELQFFSFESIASATDNFSITNKLGEGGYGPVYKGKLHDGQEIAIKRLSRNSGQGLVEFKNELALIAKLQHTNLVRLVGCCIEREEKILIYEYMPNKSLDFFLFDPRKKNLLDWKKRFNIIEGIVQGLLYLHKYSRLRIIHRDLKASNILLDDETNPKISDFGMARIFGPNETEANTDRVVGTYGYMSPEYAMEGVFSVKSDVFSFGVMLLEIVSGKKNNSYCHAERPLNLIGHAWELYRDGRVLELMDPILADSDHKNEVLRCIHVGLLCVQGSPADRPTMSEVASMISNETSSLSIPKKPAFFIGRNLIETADITKQNSENCSLNKVSITEMEAR